MCQNRPKPAEGANGDQQQQQQQQDRLYPDVERLVDMLRQEMRREHQQQEQQPQQQQQQQQQQQSQERRQQQWDGFHDFLRASLDSFFNGNYEGGNNGSNNNGSNNNASNIDDHLPSAPPPQPEEQQHQDTRHGPWYNAQRSTNVSGGGGFVGGWGWPGFDSAFFSAFDSDRRRREREEEERRRRRREECQRRCMATARLFLLNLASAFTAAASSLGLAALVLIPALVLPHWMVALGIFLALARELKWPIRRLGAAGLMLLLLNGMCGGMLR